MQRNHVQATRQRPFVNRKQSARGNHARVSGYQWACQTGNQNKENPGGDDAQVMMI